MAVVEAGSAAHGRAVAELEAGLGPFDDPAWREDLALLSDSVRAGALLLARDCAALVALARRVPRSPGDERGGTPWTSFVREVAVAKKISDQAAHAEVALAGRLLSCHPVALAALQAGRAPAQRARLLVEECARYDPLVATVADRLLADRLTSLPPWRIRQEVTQLALRLNPEGAARREATATAGRGASLTALADAQAEVVLTGPAPLVQRWWDALTDRARALKAAGDPRSLSALRFDLAVHTDPGTLTGHDPLSQAVGIPAPAADRTGAADRVPAVPAPAEPAPAEPTPDEPAPAAAPADLAPAASGPPPSGLGLGVPLRDDARCTRPVQARIDVPAATALGLSNEPGWLDGYGWVSAPLSRRLLTVAELRKACVAPHSGQLIDLAERVTRPRLSPYDLREALRRMVLTPHQLRRTATDTQPQHDPSPALSALVAARDRWCDGPTGRQVPARRCDTDHEIPWPTGPTAAGNLLSRSARTHQLKHTGWIPARDATGTTWTSPAGQVAFTPRFDHPPPPPSPQRRLPDPDALAAHEAALLRVHEWPDDPLIDSGQAEPEPPRPQEPPDEDRARGWPDEPAF